MSPAESEAVGTILQSCNPWDSSSDDVMGIVLKDVGEHITREDVLHRINEIWNSERCPQYEDNWMGYSVFTEIRSLWRVRFGDSGKDQINKDYIKHAYSHCRQEKRDMPPVWLILVVYDMCMEAINAVSPEEDDEQIREDKEILKTVVLRRFRNKLTEFDFENIWNVALRITKDAPSFRVIGDDRKTAIAKVKRVRQLTTKNPENGTITYELEGIRNC